jgi:hypothetical protein
MKLSGFFFSLPTHARLASIRIYNLYESKDYRTYEIWCYTRKIKEEKYEKENIVNDIGAVNNDGSGIKHIVVINIMLK